MILAIDIGGTFIKWAVSQGYSLTDVRGKVPTPQDSFESLVGAIARIAEALSERPEGIAVSLPGTVDAATGLIVQGGALQYANGRNLVEALRERLNLPSSIQNDARCAALAELELGELEGCTDGVMVVIGTGIGGAVVSGGRLVTGAAGAAGELSMLAVRPLRQEGMAGLLGNRSGMRGLLAYAAEVLGREGLTGEGLMALVDKGDAQATAVLDEALADLADAMLSLQFLLDPQRFVIGGGISANPTYMAHLTAQYEKAFATLPFQAPHAEVVAARFRNDANLLGAVVHYGTASR
jgi:predicted NBD/HSP70 family sugar kinase